jgi:hypothetical protein
MFEQGWVHDSEVLVQGADFCRGCAHLLRVMRLAEYCSWCGAALDNEEGAEATGWAYFADEIGTFHACCPGCLVARFGITVRVNRNYRSQ